MATNDYKIFSSIKPNNVTLKDATKEKEMIDRIRERNGNLEIMVSKQENRVAEL